MKRIINSGAFAFIAVIALSSCSSNMMNVDTFNKQDEINKEPIRTVEIKKPNFETYEMFDELKGPNMNRSESWWGYKFAEYPDRIFFFPKQGEGLCSTTNGSVIYVQKYSDKKFTPHDCSGLGARSDGKPNKQVVTQGLDNITYVTRQVYPTKEKIELYGYFCRPGEVTERSFTMGFDRREYTSKSRFVKHCTRGIVTILPTETEK